MATANSHDRWVMFNQLSMTHQTKDGTCVASELVENAQCLVDVFYISKLRENQRKAFSEGDDTQIIGAIRKGDT